ncbi:biotin/lipoyl-binding protein [Adhaeribacter sp. BT258]|uniref:Biotin/lipoyl-binding protein n=1 Tax=Adhaeribacter terrigena TaxID=2793070 RepID=A0ABS1BWH4_9BACT|nr:acetyl-CoA carboxylase biotin carboxyl carrier protein subunit [Adhaeribacter terrigena]MBK0401385.1 biotin/lipoyl-binding protein [Adhaeribacter terrigena]
MLQVKSGDASWQVENKQGNLFLNGQPFEWDLVALDANRFHIIKNNVSYMAELVEADYQTKTFTLKINGTLHTVSVKDRFDLLLDQMGMSNANEKKLNDIKAPMPGLVLDIKVKIGDEVKKGDQILILEAMKMENILKSPGDGVVKAIKVNVKDNVEKGQVLLEF